MGYAPNMIAALYIMVGLSFLASSLGTIPSLVVAWAEWHGPAVVYSAQVDERVVALSIDDGPSASTPEILQVLGENDVQATFFLIGTNVEARPAVAREIVAAGHEVGHHMMEDRPSIRLPGDVFEERFDEMDRLLGGLGGSHLFRPGSGWYNERMVRAAASRGYTTVLGTVYPFDAELPAGRMASWYVLQNIAPGSILVLHDGPDRGARTAEVLRTVLPELRSRGYRVVTVSSLLSLEEHPFPKVAGRLSAGAESPTSPGRAEFYERSP